MFLYLYTHPLLGVLAGACLLLLAGVILFCTQSLVTRLATWFGREDPVNDPGTAACAVVLASFFVAAVAVPAILLAGAFHAGGEAIREGLEETYAVQFDKWGRIDRTTPSVWVIDGTAYSCVIDADVEDPRLVCDGAELPRAGD